MWKNNDPLSRTAVLLSFVAVISYSCKSSKPTYELNTEREKDSVTEGQYGYVPYLRKGSLAFKAKDALKEVESRKKEEQAFLEKSKEMFESQVRDGSQGGKNTYWIPPSKSNERLLALKDLPKDPFGFTDWTASATGGFIAPMDSLEKGKRATDAMVSYNADIVFTINDNMMANVLFSHKIHNYWLSCKTCHSGMFIPKIGANKFQMADIWGGKYCGRCHGKVAFQPKGFENCIRCHNQKRTRVFF